MNESKKEKKNGTANGGASLKMQVEFFAQKKNRTIQFRFI
jgi:hypothetical protein